MKEKSGILFVLFLLFFTYQSLQAETPADWKVDKALCAELLRFGEEAYERGRFLDAKNYFRKAVQADPGSKKAWRSYDKAIVFALAEKAEQKSDLLSPGTSKGKAGPAHPGSKLMTPASGNESLLNELGNEPEAEEEEFEGC